MVKLSEEIKNIIVDCRKKQITIKKIIDLIAEEHNIKISPSTVWRVYKEKEKE